MAYFAGLRKDCDDDQLAAWKASWKIKKDTWNKKRQRRRKEENLDEEEEEPSRKKQKARKSQFRPEEMKADDGSPVYHV